MPDNVRDNIDCEGFGYRWDDKQSKWEVDFTTTNMPGVYTGLSQTVAFKPFLSLVT